MHERLKMLRKVLNLTQQKFATILGLKQNTISSYEMGRATPSNIIISSICQKFNVNENWLRDGIGEMFIRQTKDNPQKYINKNYFLIWHLHGLNNN
ncbi:MAG: helix-turn-helix domain-containing protein [Lachnospiraceae bacterium]